MDNENETEDASENQGNALTPIIKLPAGLLKKVREPWKKCLIVRLLGKNIGYTLFVNRMRKLWNLQAGFETLAIGNGFFIVKFEVMEDYSKVFTGGPWVVMDRYVIVRKWQPDFKSDEAEEDTTAIWVRFPNLPIEYYDEKVLYHIVKVLGKPLKVDINTAMAARGKYARVCVKMDLRKPLISHITIRRYDYVVEYEHLHLLCFSCSRVGHRKEKCHEFRMIQPEKAIQNMTVNQTDTATRPRATQPTGQKNKELSNETETHSYGSWTIATTRRKYHHGKQKQKAHVYKSNRFESLQVDQDYGETSAASEIKEAQRKYVDLDMGPQSFHGEISYVQKQSPIGPTKLMKDGEPDLGLDVASGPKEKELNAQGSPNSLLVTTVLTFDNNTNALITATAPDIRVQTRKGKPPDSSVRKEGCSNGGNGREHSNVRTSSGPIQNSDVLRTRERSVSPRRNRLVARRGEASDSTMVGDRLAQRKAHGACETSEATGGRPEECAKYIDWPTHKLSSMDMLIWNCRGAGNARFQRKLRELVRLHKLDMIILMETKVELNTIGMFFNNLGFMSSTHVDPIGRSGGIWLLWNPSQANVRVHDASSQMITATISR
ncbi:hypothetical protein ACSBR2_004301 [Camellia fascicularis]